MSKPILIALGAGVASAAALIVFISGSPGAVVLVNLTPLPLMMVGLGLGVVPAGVAGASGAIFAGVFSGGLGAGIYLAMFAVPSVLMVRQALLNRPTGPGGKVSWYPAGSIVSLLAATVAVALVLVIAFGGGFQEDLRALVATTVERGLETMAPGMDPADRALAVLKVTPIFPGMVVTSWVLMLIGNGALAQAILVRSGHNLRPRIKVSALTLPDWASWLLVGAAAMALLGAGNLEYVGQNLALVLALPFLFLGLAVAHALSARLPRRGMVLVAMYVAVIFFDWAKLVVVGAGLIEQWAGLRRRFASSGPQTKDD